MYTISVNGVLSQYTMYEKQFIDTLSMVKFLDKSAQIVVIAANVIINFTNGDQHIISKEG